MTYAVPLEEWNKLVDEKLKLEAENADLKQERKELAESIDAYIKENFGGKSETAERLIAVLKERDDLKKRCKELEKEVKYTDAFGKSMNDYHQAYHKQTKKVNELTALVEKMAGDIDMIVRQIEAEGGKGYTVHAIKPSICVNIELEKEGERK